MESVCRFSSASKTRQNSIITNSAVKIPLERQCFDIGEQHSNTSSGQYIQRLYNDSVDCPTFGSYSRIDIQSPRKEEACRTTQLPTNFPADLPGSIILWVSCQTDKHLQGLTNVDFLPPNDVAPARRLRIKKALEWGALWVKEWSPDVTHIIVDGDLVYQDVLSYLKIPAIPVSPLHTIHSTHIHLNT